MRNNVNNWSGDRSSNSMSLQSFPILHILMATLPLQRKVLLELFFVLLPNLFACRVLLRMPESIFSDALL